MQPLSSDILSDLSVALEPRIYTDPLKRKELALAYWTISGAIMFLGSGRFSLDYLIRNYFKK